MHIRYRCALLGLAAGFVAALASAADPAPLLKPVVPAGTSVRVRFAVTPGFPKVMSFPAQIPNGKKKAELMDVTVAFDTLNNPSYITVGKLRQLGYDVPKGSKEFVLSELLVPASQIAPKLAKEADVVVKFTNLKFTVLPESPLKDDTVHFCDLCISSFGLFPSPALLQLEPRLSFADNFLELTVPAMNVKRPGTGDIAVPEMTINGDTKLVPIVGPMTVRDGGQSGFTFGSINGMEAIKTADGKIVPVNVAVASILNSNDGLRMSIPLARATKVEMDQVNIESVGLTTKSDFVTGKIKELRLGVLTGPGLKTQKDLVFKDVTVLVNIYRTDHYIHIGQKFIDTHFADTAYAHGGDGWKFHARVDPELLFDHKPKIDPKQKVDPMPKIDPKQKVDPKVDPKPKIDPKPKP